MDYQFTIWEKNSYSATIHAAFGMLYLHRNRWNLPASLIPCIFPWDEFVKLNPEAREMSQKFEELYGETSENQMSTAVAALWAWKHKTAVRRTFTDPAAPAHG
jgi:hypothetical protein